MSVFASLLCMSGLTFLIHNCSLHHIYLNVVHCLMYSYVIHNFMMFEDLALLLFFIAFMFEVGGIEF